MNRKPWDAIDRAHVVTMPTIQSSSEYFIFLRTACVCVLCTQARIVKVANYKQMPFQCVRHPTIILLTWTWFYWNLCNVILTHSINFIYLSPRTMIQMEWNQYLVLSIVSRFEWINCLFWAFQMWNSTFLENMNIEHA